jgi:hypothetical protein
LNLRRPAFFWPARQELTNERCTKGGGGWSDKSLGLWLLSDLPPQQEAGDGLRYVLPASSEASEGKTESPHEHVQKFQEFSTRISIHQFKGLARATNG